MKKVLALVLAVVLAFGMTTVAFAAPKAGKATDINFGETLYSYDDAGNGSMNAVTADLKANSTYYFDVTNDGGLITDSGDRITTTISKLSSLSEYKIRTAIDEGAGYISAKPTFVIKKVGGVNRAYVMFKTADKFNKEAVSFDMSVSAFSGSADYLPKDYNKDTGKATVSVMGDIGYGTTDISLYTVVDGPLANFDNVDGDCEIEFKDNVVFAVNGKDQKDLFLRMSNSDDAITDKYPDADLKIVKFEGNNKTFRRTGVLTIPAEMVENKEGKMVAPVLYNYEGGKLTVNKDAKYNEEKAAYEIKTNKLGSYVVSGTALAASAPTTDEPVIDEPVAPGTVPNPDTGANDFVGLAVALAVVSVAGIAVAKRK